MLFGNVGTAAEAEPASVRIGVIASPIAAVAPMVARSPRRRTVVAFVVDRVGRTLNPLLRAIRGRATCPFLREPLQDRPTTLCIPWTPRAALLRLTDPHGFVVKAAFAVVLSVAHRGAV